MINPFGLSVGRIFMFYREGMALRTGENGRINGLYLLTNFVLTNKFCMEMMLIWQGPRNFCVLSDWSQSNTNYVLSGVILTGNHLYTGPAKY